MKLLKDITIGQEVVYLPPERTEPLPVIGTVERTHDGMVDIRVPARNWKDAPTPEYVARDCDPRWIFPAEECGMSLLLDGEWKPVDPRALAKDPHEKFIEGVCRCPSCDPPPPTLMGGKPTISVGIGGEGDQVFIEGNYEGIQELSKALAQLARCTSEETARIILHRETSPFIIELTRIGA